MLKRLILSAVFAIATCAGCGLMPSVIGNGDSGIQGTVTAGPTCPVESNPPIPGCEDRPLAATVIVRSPATGAELTRFTSADDGTFRVSLIPGTYVLDPQSTTASRFTAPPGKQT